MPFFKDISTSLVKQFSLFTAVTLSTVIALSWNELARSCWKKEGTEYERKRHLKFTLSVTAFGIVVMIFFTVLGVTPPSSDFRAES